MKRVLAFIATAAISLGAIVATPVAAQAVAPRFTLPAACDLPNISAKEMRTIRDQGYDKYDLRQADVHPSKGLEWVFTTYCNATNQGTNDVLIIANSKGQILKHRTFKNSEVNITSINATDGIRMQYTKAYTNSRGVTTVYWNRSFYKWNKTAKDFKYTWTATPAWVKNLSTAIANAEDKRAIKAMKITTSRALLFRKRMAAMDTSSGPIAFCDVYSAKGTSCFVATVDEYPDFVAFQLKFASVKGTHTITSIGKILREKNGLVG